MITCGEYCYAFINNPRYIMITRGEYCYVSTHRLLRLLCFLFLPMSVTLLHLRPGLRLHPGLAGSGGSSPQPVSIIMGVRTHPLPVLFSALIAEPLFSGILSPLPPPGAAPASAFPASFLSLSLRFSICRQRRQKTTQSTSPRATAMQGQSTACMMISPG